jgi:hypothetical protein
MTCPAWHMLNAQKSAAHEENDKTQGQEKLPRNRKEKLRQISHHAPWPQATETATDGDSQKRTNALARSHTPNPPPHPTARATRPTRTDGRRIAHGTGAKRTDGGNGGDDLAELELVQYGGLTSCVETDHEDTHLPLGEELLEQLGEGEPHGGSTPRGRARDRSGGRA